MLDRKYELERKYQAKLIKKLDRLFPGSLVLKNDPGYRQGIPDLSIFLGPRYAFLEVKASEPLCEDDWEPNQEWYLEQINGWSFASVIYPENERLVLRDLQQALSPTRTARLSQSQ
jgi:hypothetical protein